MILLPTIIAIGRLKATGKGELNNDRRNESFPQCSKSKSENVILDLIPNRNFGTDDHVFSLEEVARSRSLVLESWQNRRDNRPTSSLSKDRSLLRGKRKVLPNFFLSKGFDKVQYFEKYIPISKEAMGNGKYDKISIDKYFPSCWFEIASWFLFYGKQKKDLPIQLGKNSATTASYDDDDDDENSDEEMKIKEYALMMSANAEALSKYEREIYLKRFDEIPNLKVCVANAEEHISYRVDLYVPMSGKLDVWFLNLKTEFLMDCLKYFFVPGVEANIFWINDIEKTQTSLENSRKLINLFTSKVAKSQDILMILSPDASYLIKHKNLAFLATVKQSADTNGDILVYREN